MPDLSAASREGHGRQNWTSHGDSGGLEDAALPTPGEKRIR